MSTNKEVIIEGMESDCQFEFPDSKPSWLDQEKFIKGQKVFRENAFGLIMSNYFNLITGFCVENICNMMMFSQRSSTESKAIERYAETGLYLILWYKLKPWEKPNAWKHVNKLHLRSANKIRNLTPNERSKRISNFKKRANYQPSYLDEVLLSNLKKLKETTFADLDYSLYNDYRKSDRVFSQTDMIFVQTAFFSSFISNPELYGYHDSDEESLMALVHFWRVMGYYLGIDDRFNAAQGDNLQEIITNLNDLIPKVVQPAFLNLTPMGIHLAKTVSNAHATDYHVIVYKQYRDNGIELNDLWAAFSWSQKLKYYTLDPLFNIYSSSKPLKAWLNKNFISFCLKMSRKFYSPCCAQLDKFGEES